MITGSNYYSLYRTINAGQTWNAATITGITSSDLIIDIMMPDSLTGYAVTNSSIPKIFKTTDGGLNWASQSFTGISNGFASDIYFTSADTGFLVCNSLTPTVYKTVDGGSVWTPFTLPVTNYATKTDVFFLNSQQGYILTVDPRIFKTTDGGNNWAEKSSGHYNYLYDIENPGGKTLYACGNSIMKSVDSGSTWTSKLTVSGASFLEMCFTDSLTGYACGSIGTFRKTNNGGQSWTSASASFPGSLTLRCIKFINTTTGFMGGDNGKLYKTIDAGVTWTSIATGVTLSIGAIHFPNADTGYAVGETGFVFRTIDGGANWTRLTNSITTSLSSVYFFDGKNGLAAGSSALYRTSNAGVTWTVSYPGFGDDIQSLVFVNNYEGYMIQSSFNGIIYRTIDGGLSWALVAVPTNSYLFDLAVFGDKILVVGSSGKTVLLTSRVIAPTATLSAQRCGPGNVTLSATASANQRIRWFDTPLAFTPLDTGVTVTMNFTQSDTVYVSAFDSSLMCESYRKPVVITIKPLPTPLISPATNQSINQGDSLHFTLSPTTYASYQWKRDNVNIPGAYTTSIYAKIQGSYSASATSSQGCSNTSNSVFLTVSPLPVTWLEFYALHLPDNIVQLHWKTASETNSDFFEVQRSLDNINWKSIGSVKAMFNTTVVSKYQFDDSSIPVSSRIIHYRIKQVDKDKKFDYSKILILDIGIENKQAISIYPNPFTCQINIMGLELNGSHIIEVYNQYGEKLRAQVPFQVQGNVCQADLSGLKASGVYYLTIDGVAFKLVRE